jgi:hypothetical protein
MLQPFYMEFWMLCCNGFQVFHVFFASALSACFKCFIYLQTYVANVSYGCFKSKSGVAHAAWRQWLADSGLPQGFGSYLMPSSHGAPRPLLSLPSLPFPPSHHDNSSSVGKPYPTSMQVARCSCGGPKAIRSTLSARYTWETSSRGDVRALVTPFNKRTKMVQIDQTNRSEVRNLWAP